MFLVLIPMTFIFLGIVNSGCSSNMIVKECHKVEGLKNVHVCKTTKQWEDFEEEEK